MKQREEFIPSRWAQLALKYSQLWVKPKDRVQGRDECPNFWAKRVTNWRVKVNVSVVLSDLENFCCGKEVSVELIPKGLQHLVLEHNLKKIKKWKLLESLFVEISWNMKQFSLQAQHLGVD